MPESERNRYRQESSRTNACAKDTNLYAAQLEANRSAASKQALEEAAAGTVWPWGVGDLNGIVRPSFIGEAASRYSLNQNTAMETSKALNDLVTPSEGLIKRFEAMDEEFHLRASCQAIGLCYRKHADHWDEIVLHHSHFQQCLKRLASKEMLKSSDALVCLQGRIDADPNYCLQLWRLVGMQVLKPRFSILVRTIPNYEANNNNECDILLDRGGREGACQRLCRVCRDLCL